MKTRYYVCGLGYDENNCVTDFEVSFGDFDTHEEAGELFWQLMNRDDESFFENAKDVYRLLIQLEECEEDEVSIECINVIDYFWVCNPKFQTEVIETNDNKEDKKEKKCENCKNQCNSYVCEYRHIDINERKPCYQYAMYPKPITVRELITVLEKLPQDSPVKVDTEGLFAVKGAYTESDSVYVDVSLIGW